VPCDIFSQERTSSGVCNNIAFPHWGEAKGPMPRYVDTKNGKGIMVGDLYKTIYYMIVC